MLNAILLTVAFLTPSQEVAGSCRWYCASASPAWKLVGQAVLLPWYAYQELVLHEVGHLVAGEIAGIQVVSFKPWPCYTNKGRFVFGQVHPTTHREGRADGWNAVGPLVVDVVLFGASDLLLNTAVDRRGPVAPFLLVGGMVMPLIDWVVFAHAGDYYADVKIMERHLRLDPKATVLAMDLLALVGLYRVIANGLAVFGGGGRAAPDDSRFSLAVSPSSFGVRFGW